MVERKQLYDGLSHAAWGYFFLYFDINLGTVSILPRFVGWLLFLSAIEKLKEERRDLALLRPLGILLMLWSGAGWLASWAGADVDGLFPPLDLVVTVAQMYFHFQFLTDCAALAEPYSYSGIERRILRWRAIQTVLLTGMGILMEVGAWFGKISGYMLAASTVVYLIMGLCLMAALFALRKFYREDPLSHVEKT